MGCTATPTARGLAVADRRHFLARALDRALARDILDVVDVNLIERDVIVMALAYLARHQWRMTDTADVRDAAAIVCMYVEDGLFALAYGDVDTAATVLASHPLKDCYRASGALVDDRRRAIESRIHTEKVVIGPASAAIARAIIPRALIAGALPDDRDVLNAYRGGASVAALRERLDVLPGFLDTWERTTRLLPWEGVTAAWRSIAGADVFAAVPDEEFEVASVAWLGALIAGNVRTSPSIVVTVDDIRAFLGRCVEHDDRGAFVADAALTRAAAAWAVWCPEMDAETVTTALRHAVAGGLGTVVPLDPVPADFPAWANAWSLHVFLQVTEHERAQLFTRDVAGDADEPELLFDRMAATRGAAERARVFDALRIEARTTEELMPFLARGGAAARELVDRITWGTRSADEIAAVFDGGVPDEVARRCALAIVEQRSDFALWSPDLLHSVTLAVLNNDGGALDAFLRAWRPTSVQLIRYFRGAPGSEVAHDWLDVALRFPKIFADLLEDAASMPHELAWIRAYLAEDVSGTPRAHPTAFLACVEEIERRSRRRLKGDPPLRDPDLRVAIADLHPKLLALLRTQHESYRKPPRVRPRGKRRSAKKW